MATRYSEYRLMDQLSILADTLPVQIWFISDIDTYGPVNRHHAEFMGLKKKDMEFRKLEEFLSSEAADMCRQSSTRVFATKEVVNSEEWIVNAKGERRLISITKAPKFSDNSMDIEYIICFGRDITESRNIEIQNKQNEKNFRIFIETIDDIVLIGTTEGKIIYSNPSASVKLGYTEDEIKKMHIIDVHPLWVQKEATIILSDMLNGKRTSCPLPLISKKGSVIPAETRVWLGKWNSEDCIFGISKDLSREQELLQRFEKLFRMNPALMAINSISDRNFIDINGSFSRTLGYSREEIIGKNSRDLGIFDDLEKHERVFRQIESYGSIREIELKVKNKSGEILDGLFSGDIIESQGQKFILTVMIDITERKRAEAERERVIKELQLAMEQIKTLRGIIPICSGCKKIRDDKGYWEQVESYVSKHTDAQFSHGICPECVKTLYPELASSLFHKTVS